MTFWMSFWIFWISFWISLKNHGLVQKTISISHWIFTVSSSHHETSDPTDLRGTGNFRPLFATCQKLLPFPGKLTSDSWILMVFEFLMEFSWMLWMLFVKSLLPPSPGSGRVWPVPPWASESDGSCWVWNPCWMVVDDKMMITCIKIITSTSKASSSDHRCQFFHQFPETHLLKASWASWMLPGEYSLVCRLYLEYLKYRIQLQSFRGFIPRLSSRLRACGHLFAR